MGNYEDFEISQKGPDQNQKYVTEKSPKKSCAMNLI